VMGGFEMVVFRSAWIVFMAVLFAVPELPFGLIIKSGCTWPWTFLVFELGAGLINPRCEWAMFFSRKTEDFSGSPTITANVGVEPVPLPTIGVDAMKNWT